MEKLLLMGRAPLTSQMVATLVSTLVTTLAMASLAIPQDPPSHPLVLATLHTAPVSQPDHQPPLLTLSCKTEANASRPATTVLEALRQVRGVLEVLEVLRGDILATRAGGTRDIPTIEDR